MGHQGSTQLAFDGRAIAGRGRDHGRPLPVVQRSTSWYVFEHHDLLKFHVRTTAQPIDASLVPQLVYLEQLQALAAYAAGDHAVLNKQGTSEGDVRAIQPSTLQGHESRRSQHRGSTLAAGVPAGGILLEYEGAWVFGSHY